MVAERMHMVRFLLPPQADVGVTARLRSHIGLRLNHFRGFVVRAECGYS
jgi:hypothetical protein